MRRTARQYVLVLLLPLVSGCYVSRPATLATLAPGEDFRIVLSDAGVEHVTRTSVETSREMSGQLLSLTPDSVTFTTRLRGPAYAGQALGNMRQAFTIATADIDQVTVPELHRARTGLVVAAAVAVGVTVIAAILEFTGIAGESDVPNDPTAPVFAR